MSNIFKGRKWETVCEERAKKIAKERGGPYQLYIFDANKTMMDEILNENPDKNLNSKQP